jgi:hypothetical protein
MNKMLKEVNSNIALNASNGFTVKSIDSLSAKSATVVFSHPRKDSTSGKQVMFSLINGNVLSMEHIVEFTSA